MNSGFLRPPAAKLVAFLVGDTEQLGFSQAHQPVSVNHCAWSVQPKTGIELCKEPKNDACIHNKGKEKKLKENINSRLLCFVPA